MKTKSRPLRYGLYVILLACERSYSQGSVGNGAFQDLNFEAASIVYVSPTDGATIQAGPAAPGWTCAIGPSPLSTLSYDTIALNGDTIALFDQSFGALDGNYSMFLVGNLLPGAPSVSISQTGLIPSGAKSINFLAGYGANKLVLTVNGVGVPFISLGNPYLYGANISQFAGQTATLSFVEGAGSTVIDDIAFSGQSIPEPSTRLLLTCSGVALGAAGSSMNRRRWTRWRKVDGCFAMPRKLRVEFPGAIYQVMSRAMRPLPDARSFSPSGGNAERESGRGKNGRLVDP